MVKRQISYTLNKFDSLVKVNGAALGNKFLPNENFKEC